MIVVTIYDARRKYKGFNHWAFMVVTIGSMATIRGMRAPAGILKNGRVIAIKDSRRFNNSS